MISTTQLGLCLALFPLGAIMMACSDDDDAKSDFTSSPETRAYVGQEYTYSVTTRAETGEVPVIVAAELPQWLTFTDHEDGTALLRGIPSPADIGENPVELRLDAGDRSNTQRFEIQVHSEEFVEIELDDEFEGEEVQAVWRFHDPRGSSDLAISGGAVRISVPAGMSHDLWRGAENQAPRLLRSVDNANFGVEAKFDSTPEQRFQIQGIVAQETDDRFVRLDMHHNGTSLRIYAAYVDGMEARVRVNRTIEGAAPNRLRVLRSGQYWMLQYAADGEDWSVASSFTQPLVVREIGVFAGNAHGVQSPAYTMVVDYIRNAGVTEMPEIERPKDPTPPTDPDADGDPEGENGDPVDGPPAGEPPPGDPPVDAPPDDASPDDASPDDEPPDEPAAGPIE